MIVEEDEMKYQIALLLIKRIGDIIDKKMLENYWDTREHNTQQSIFVELRETEQKIVN